jgi:hypothetical protein
VHHRPLPQPHRDAAQAGVVHPGSNRQQLPRTGHVVIAVNDLDQGQMQAIAQACSGWASIERIDEAAPTQVYASKLQASQIVIGWPDPGARA